MHKIDGASLVAQMVKNPSAMWETWVRTLGWEDPLEGSWQPTPILLPRASHGQRSLEAVVRGVTQSQTQLSCSAQRHSQCGLVKALKRRLSVLETSASFHSVALMIENTDGSGKLASIDTVTNKMREEKQNLI